MLFDYRFQWQETVAYIVTGCDLMLFDYRFQSPSADLISFSVVI